MPALCSIIYLHISIFSFLRISCSYSRQMLESRVQPADGRCEAPPPVYAFPRGVSGENGRRPRDSTRPSRICVRNDNEANPLCGGRPGLPMAENKYTCTPSQDPSPRRRRRVPARKANCVSRCRGILALLRPGSIFGAGIVLLYGRPIARGGSGLTYLPIKGINIEWQVHSVQSPHIPPGRGLFSTHAKLSRFSGLSFSLCLSHSFSSRSPPPCTPCKPLYIYIYVYIGIPNAQADTIKSDSFDSVVCFPRRENNARRFVIH